MLFPSSPSPFTRFTPVLTARQLLAGTMEQWMIYAHFRIRTRSNDKRIASARLWGALTWPVAPPGSSAIIYIKNQKAAADSRTLAKKDPALSKCPEIGGGEKASE